MTNITLENRLAIYELLAEYSHHVDNYRGKEWSELFIEGGKLVGPDILIEGRQAFVDKAQTLKDGVYEYRHSITNIYLEPESNNEQAVARGYGLVSDWAKKPAELAIFVEYRFQVVKQDERWSIAEMRVNMPYL
ncbi:nuclear transport factor 2 family protein [Halioxenophilus sp. WMMB6]|uniref:nuclear transport factor 2 family protein n=1 Tax=Halioxenophilus sp. WMMB6 TaxID=3073815 RepID=UPI00295E337F|nr:nuclear transport factor 2 family protein [Halioxenophilus sp. WMMB6]